jgi:hypothetical protein
MFMIMFHPNNNVRVQIHVDVYFQMHVLVPIQDVQALIDLICCSHYGLFTVWMAVQSCRGHRQGVKNIVHFACKYAHMLTY